MLYRCLFPLTLRNASTFLSFQEMDKNKKLNHINRRENVSECEPQKFTLRSQTCKSHRNVDRTDQINYTRLEKIKIKMMLHGSDSYVRSTTEKVTRTQTHSQQCASNLIGKGKKEKEARHHPTIVQHENCNPEICKRSADWILYSRILQDHYYKKLVAGKKHSLSFS